MAAIAVVVIEAPAGRLLHIQSQLSVAFTTLHIAATTHDQKDRPGRENKPETVSDG